jgi:hypothetical protein
MTMTKEEAKKIFKSWRHYMEIADKMKQIFSVVPESFLPYPADKIEEALHMKSKEMADAGEMDKAAGIESTGAGYLNGHYDPDEPMSDEEALKRMHSDLTILLEHPELMEIKLNKLKEVRESWSKIRGENRHIEDENFSE